MSLPHVAVERKVKGWIAEMGHDVVSGGQVTNEPVDLAIVDASSDVFLRHAIKAWLSSTSVKVIVASPSGLAIRVAMEFNHTGRVAAITWPFHQEELSELISVVADPSVFDSDMAWHGPKNRRSH